MRDVWVTIAALTVATAAIKAAGPALVGGRELPVAVMRVIALFAPALLAALIVTETFGGPGPSITLDERAAGLAAAAGVLLTTRSLIGAVVAAAAATALLRLVT
ncbi:MAG: AzlD domain-containing protein [Thermoleophilaceae bacterium]|jgi:branched-subunit amino acid transport protein